LSISRVLARGVAAGQRPEAAAHLLPPCDAWAATLTTCWAR